MQNYFSTQLSRVAKSLWLTSKKIPLAMRLLILLSICLINMVQANNSYAQKATISINVHNQTVKEVLKGIEKQSEFNFFYDNDQLDLNRRISITISNSSIFNVLKQIFATTNIQYSILDKSIILTTKTPVQSDNKNRINGKVVDAKGEPIIGASIKEKNTSNGTITDLNGCFSFLVSSDNAVIKISYVGYQSQELKTVLGKPLNIILIEDAQALQEVVVVGFGVQKKINLTGAVSQVKMDDVLGNRPVVNAMAALQGAMPGLQITANNDAPGPGESKNFNIRGTTSINGGSPLVLIDNVPGSLDMLNPEDIESVSVLKDAASSAIYGARAAFGVILVTTKKAKKGEAFHVNYNNNFGFQSSVDRPKQANGLEWMQGYLDAEFNAGKYYTGQDIKTWMGYLTEYRKNRSQFQTTENGIYTEPDTGVEYYLKENDAYALMLDKFGFLQAHNISVSGGTEKLAYRMSLGYNNEQGILITDKDRYKRLSGNAYISAEITPWLSQSIDIRYAQSEKNMPVISDKTHLYDLRLPTIYPEGSLTLSDGRSLLTNTPSNMLRIATDDNTIRDNARILSRTVLKPLKGLEIAFEYTFNKSLANQRKNKAVIDYTTVQLAVQQTAPTSSLESKNETTDYNAFNLYGTYHHLWNDSHNFTAMAGFNQESSNYRNLYAYSYDMINDKYPSHNTATGENRVITEGHTAYAVRGAFYRLNYDYKGKYLFETSGRYDGSSKFPKNSRFGFFPSASVGWNIAHEGFLKSIAANWLSDLKVRASWGQIGNQSISPYQFVPVMGTEAKGDVKWLVNGAKPVTLKAPGLVRSNFTWETVETLGFGLDITAFNGRFQGVLDWYRRDTKDMLAPGIELPAVVGAAAPLQNTANLRTKGWEISFNWRDKIGPWGYNIGFNIYDSKTIVTKYKNESKIIKKSDGNNQYYEGYEIGSIWGFETDGFYSVDDFEDTNTWKLKEGVVTIDGVNPRPGDIKFKNLRDDKQSVNLIDEGDGTLENPGDRKIIGNNTLRFQYGINLGVSYKGFDLSVMLQGVGKRDVWISDERRWPFDRGQFGSIFKDQLNYWKPVDIANGDYTAVNPNADYFRIYGQVQNLNSNKRPQTKFLMDGSYLRVKNVTFSYSFPREWLIPVTLTGLKAFVSCENLHTFTKLMKGYDPERLSWNYPFYRTISFGINVTL